MSDVAAQPLSPGRLALRRLFKNRIAIAGMVLLTIFYLIAIFAGFFSPYSPTTAEFRGFFFHPPTGLHFQDDSGALHWRPAIYRTFLLDRSRILYASAAPLHVYYRLNTANENPYFADTIESDRPILTVGDERGKIVAEVYSLQETDRNSGIFTAIVPIETQPHHLTITTTDGKRLEFPVVTRPPNQINNPLSPDLFLMDSSGNYLDAYYPEQQRYPLQFFVHGWKYRILWIFESDLHLFGVQEPAHIFLFGTDQSGRDLFSRILFGAQISLSVGLVGVLLTTILGMLLGGIAGYYGGNIDSFVMRFAEVLMSIPALYLILALRNTIPDRLQDSYDKLREIGLETFAWQNTPGTFTLVMIVVILLLSYYIYRKGPTITNVTAGLGAVGILLAGKYLVFGVLHMLQTVLPGSTHITSEWTYLFIIAILSTVGWAAMSRVIRGMVLSLKEQEYVIAARALGARDFRVIVRHILPNTFGYVIVRATLLIPAYILGEVALSFLGVGVQEPIPSWGNMLSAAQNLRVLQQFTWTLIPGIFIFLVVLSYNFLGDGLRDALDPRQK